MEELLMTFSDFFTEVSDVQGQVEHLRPAGLYSDRIYSPVVVASGNVKTIYLSSQVPLTESGEVVGEGDIAAQMEQVLRNLEISLAAAGATVEHVVKWTLYMVHGHSPDPAYEVFLRFWGQRPNPPALTIVFVAGLSHEDFLIELDATAVVPQP